MKNSNQQLETLQDIKRIMERSNRFISLSGWSGIAAGICALAGAWLAMVEIAPFKAGRLSGNYDAPGLQALNLLTLRLTWIAAGVFAAAFVSAFFFTWLRSRKEGMKLWGMSARRLMWNTVLPMLAGGLVLLRMLELGYYALLAPCCLIFYGLALVNGSKYTLGEVKYLGYGQILLGIVNLWFPGYALAFWSAGFGLLHIVYGTLMWWKHERHPF